MLNLEWLTHVALFPVAAVMSNEWWLATLAICLMPAALILLWVMVAWFCLSDQPDPRYR